MFKGEPKCRNRSGGHFLDFNVPSDIDKTGEERKGCFSKEERERERERERESRFSFDQFLVLFESIKFKHECE